MWEHEREWSGVFLFIYLFAWLIFVRSFVCLNVCPTSWINFISYPLCMCVCAFWYPQNRKNKNTSPFTYSGTNHNKVGINKRRITNKKKNKQNGKNFVSLFGKLSKMRFISFCYCKYSLLHYSITQKKTIVKESSQVKSIQVNFFVLSQRRLIQNCKNSNVSVSRQLNWVEVT